MASAVVIITLLTVAASLASWLFSRWLASRVRLSAAALAVGGAGAVLLISAVAFVVVGAASGWQLLIPVQDFSLPADPASAARSTDAWPVKRQPVEAAESPQQEDVATASERLRMSERKAEMLASAESYLEQSQYRQAVDTAREYLAVYPRDADMLSMMARCSRLSIPVPPLSSPPWSSRNGRRPTVSRPRARTTRRAGCSTTAVVAPIFTIRDAGNARRQIRYLACEVTAPGVLQVLRASGGDLTQQRLTAELRADACYAQVLAWSSTGQRTGASPDSLLRNGID